MVQRRTNTDTDIKNTLHHKKLKNLKENKWKWLSSIQPIITITKKNNTSSHLLLDHCYAFGLLTVAFWSEEVFWRRGPLLIYFCPTLDLPLDGSSRNSNPMCGPGVFYPYQVGVKRYTVGTAVQRPRFGSQYEGLIKHSDLFEQNILVEFTLLPFCPICF